MGRNFGGNQPAVPPRPALPLAADPQPKPAIGRIVHYIATDPAERFNGAEVCAAIITRVISPDRVNLRLQLDGPVPEQWLPSVAREHSFVPVEGLPSRFWRWPPRT